MSTFAIAIVIIVALFLMLGGRAPREGARETASATEASQRADAQTNSIISDCEKSQNTAQSECAQQRLDRDVVIVGPDIAASVSSNYPTASASVSNAVDDTASPEQNQSEAPRVVYVDQAQTETSKSDAPPTVGAAETIAPAVSAEAEAQCDLRAFDRAKVTADAGSDSKCREGSPQ